jgi:ribose transport system permease protein
MTDPENQLHAAGSPAKHGRFHHDKGCSNAFGDNPMRVLVPLLEFNLFWMVVVVAIPAYVFLHQSRFGRYLFAIGSNPEAARLSGVNTVRMMYVAYTLSSVCAAFVGVLLAMRIGIGNATQAEGWELQAIASSVIGGTSLFGAVGSVHGPLLGSFILTTINNGANLLNVNAFWQRIITGVLIIVIVYFDGLRRKKR